jgi:hypothetical protein
MSVAQPATPEQHDVLAQPKLQALPHFRNTTTPQANFMYLPLLWPYSPLDRAVDGGAHTTLLNDSNQHGRAEAEVGRSAERLLQGMCQEGLPR